MPPSSPPPVPAPPLPPPIPPLRLLRVWLSLGFQSFGGGAVTLALVRRAAVDQQKWVTDAEFARFWSLVQLAPGINLLALTILLGRKAAGTRGIALALSGLLLPSVGLTLALTASYARFQNALLVRGAMRGVIPAVVGLGLVTAWQIALPLLRQGRREDRAGGGHASTALSLLLLVGSALAAWRLHPPVAAILGGSAAVFAAWNWGRHRAAGGPRR